MVTPYASLAAPAHRHTWIFSVIAPVVFVALRQYLASYQSAEYGEGPPLVAGGGGRVVTTGRGDEVGDAVGVGDGDGRSDGVSDGSGDSGGSETGSEGPGSAAGRAGDDDSAARATGIATISATVAAPTVHGTQRRAVPSIGRG
jgi:hypothetical protein